MQNCIDVTLRQVQKVDGVALYIFDFMNEPLYIYGVESSLKLQIGERKSVSIKPFHIGLMNEFSVRSSFLNQFKVSVVAKEVGKTFSSVKAAINGVVLEAVVSTKALQRMNFEVGDTIIMLLPASQLYIL